MMDAPNPGYLARIIRQVNEVVTQIRRSGLLLLPDLPERAGHPIRGDGNEGDSRRYFNDSPMALMPLGIQIEIYKSMLEIYKSIGNYIWNNEFAGHNVGRVFDVWPLSITEYNDGTDSEDSLPDLEDGDSLRDLELN